MNKVYLLTGGNIGNRQFHLSEAARHIEELAGEITTKSALYETAAWGNTDQPAFLNQALELHTRLAPAKLMQLLLQIEEDMGRRRTKKNAPRVIDIDILFYNDEVIASSLVIIPHPQLQKRRFVLEPLNEIAPTLVHPVLHKTVSELLSECDDPLPVKKL